MVSTVNDIQLLQLTRSLLSKMRHIDENVSSTADVCRLLVDHFVNHMGCQLAEFWTADPRGGNLILVCWDAPHRKQLHPSHELCKRRTTLPNELSLSGLALEAKRVMAFKDLGKPLVGTHAGRIYQNQALREQLNLGTMVSIPILNSSNNHQVTGAFNFFIDSSHPLNNLLTYCEGGWHAPVKELGSVLKDLAGVVATCIESNLRERCHRMSMQVGLDLAYDRSNGPVNLQQSCKILASACRHAINASNVSVWLYEPLRKGLMGQGHAGAIEENFTAPVINGCIWDVYASGRERLIPVVAEQDDFEDLRRQGLSPQASYIFVQIMDSSGHCRGVVKCHRERCKSQLCFTYDEIAIVETMCQAFVSPLDTLLEVQRQKASLTKLSHEMRVPVMTLSEALQKMRYECLGRFVFDYNHFEEAKIYINVVKRLLAELDIRRHGPEHSPMQIGRHNLLAQVISPAKRFTIPMLRAKKMSASQIVHQGFADFGMVEIDVALVTQIVFNLIDNSIKFFGPPERDSREFKCLIDGAIGQKFLEIRVLDNGPGVDPGVRQTLFDYGQRGSNFGEDVQGEGLGMWISRAIARRHGGDLVLESGSPINGFTTSFLLTLPR